MSKRNEFKALMEGMKKASASITNEQRQGFIRQAKDDYGLSPDEAEEILKDVGLTVGPSVNYFQVLGLSIDELKNLSETEAEKRVQDAYEPLFRSLRNSQNPRKQKQLDDVREARRILIDEGKLQQYIIEYKKDNTGDTDADDDDRNKRSSGENARTIIKFRNGDEATSISQLATLMEKNTSEATDFLYQGYLEQGLAGSGETPFAIAANAVTSQFSSDRRTGLTAMVAILRGKLQMQKGSDASTPQQLARLIDQNWKHAKTLLYNGFIELWLEHTQQSQFASIAKKITNHYSDAQDIGLEELVQRLDPRIGDPEPELSHSAIDFGKITTEGEKTIHLKIKNAGRGFLYGDVQLASNIQGLQISDVDIQGRGVVTVKLDASSLTVKQTHQASLVVNTNGGNLKVPISCYIDYPTQKSIQRIAVSGLSVAAIAVVARLIVQQFGTSGWLATRLTGTGFIDWEHHYQWVEWFQWPWFEWTVYTLRAPGAGLGFVIALVSLAAGIFGYCYFFFIKKRVR